MTVGITISATEKQVAFFTPTVLKRQILAVYFDKKQHGDQHAPFRPGRRAYHLVRQNAQTPARGRELTFLQQLLKRHTGHLGHPDPADQSG